MVIAKTSSAAPGQTTLSGFLHIFGLVSLAIALPLLACFSKSPEFFIAHGTSATELLIFTAILTVVLPTSIALMALATRLLGRFCQITTHAILTSVLLGLCLMPHLKSINALAGWSVIGVSWAIGWAATVFYLKSGRLRAHTPFLAPITLIFPILFLLQNGVLSHRAPQIRALVDSTGAASAPVFFLLLDELSTEALLTESRTIDERHFPNFAALANDGYWFRDATTVGSNTLAALPAILTGAYPQKYGETPDYQQYPNNLFTLLAAAGYNVHAYEAETRLCPESINQRAAPRRSLTASVASLLADTLVLAGHTFLQRDLTGSLPDISARVAFFTKADAEAAAATRAPAFTDFLGSLSAEQNTLHFAHILLPHIPYVFLPSGKQYLDDSDLLGFQGDETNWPEDPFPVAAAQQRYLLQVQYVDHLLGKFLARLKELNVYDRAIIVVTSDHGASYRPGAGRRIIFPPDAETFPNEDAATDVLKSPTFVRLPGQKEAKIVDSKFQNTDILPTVLASLGVRAPKSVQGRNVFAETVPALEHYHLFDFYHGNRLYPHDLNILSPSYNLSMKFQTLNVDEFFRVRMGDYDSLIGQSLTETHITGDSGVCFELDVPSWYEDVDLSSSFIPAMIKGTVTETNGYALPLTFAVAVNGVIHAITRTESDPTGATLFAAMLPESAYRDGRNMIQLLLVNHDETGAIQLLETFNLGDNYADTRVDWCHQRIILDSQGNGYPMEERIYKGEWSFPETTPERFNIKGWMLDSNNHPPDSVMLFLKDRFIARARVNRDMPATAACFGSNTLRSGFLFNLSRDQLNGIVTPEDVQFYPITHEGKAGFTRTRDAGEQICQSLTGNILLPNRIIKTWDFTSLAEEERQWWFQPETEVQTDETGLTIETTNDLGGPFLDILPDSDISDCAGIRVHLTMARKTADGELPVLPKLLRFYWAGDGDIEEGTWPFSEQRRMNFEMLDPTHPDVWTATLDPNRMCGPLRKVFIGVSVPKEPLNDGESFKITLRSIELLRY